jgi:putative FmdB family regulatory protein
MPIYEYKCPGCGVFEEFHTMDKIPVTGRCPKCEGEAGRIISIPALSRTPKHVSSALEQAEKSRSEPAVIRRDHAEPRQTMNHQVNPAMEKLVGKEAARSLRAAPHPARHFRPR